MDDLNQGERFLPMSLGWRFWKKSTRFFQVEKLGTLKSASSRKLSNSQGFCYSSHGGRTQVRSEHHR